MNEAFSWLASKLHLGSGAAYGPEEVGGFIDDIAKAAAEARQKLGFGSVNASGGLTNYIAEQYEEEKRAEIQRVKDVMRIAAQGAKNKRPILNQDFRGSKFSIEQKFAQGFDPGRVLTAVREDSAKLAQRRLSAGNTPLFGGG
jgi:hypothetical protein